jgi:CheY-like chemotaxis protein
MSTANATILIVDDELVDLFIMREILEHSGYVVLAANGYDQALRLFTESAANIDLLLTDVSLPIKTGVDLARTLLQLKPELKVLFTSGWVGSTVLRSAGYPQLERLFLPKPFAASDLIESVHKILASSERLNMTGSAEKDNRDTQRK